VIQHLIARDAIVACHGQCVVEIVLVEVAHAPRANLAGALQLVERGERLLERIFAAPVQQVAVEMIGTQTRKRSITGAQCALARRVLRQHLRHEKHLVAASLDRLGHDLFRVAVHLRGVDVRHAAFEPAAQRGHSSGAITLVDVPSALSNDGNISTRVAKQTIFHSRPQLFSQEPALHGRTAAHLADCKEAPMMRARGFLLCVGFLAFLTAVAVRASGDQSTEQNAAAADQTIQAFDPSLPVLDTLANRVTRGLVIAPVKLDFTRKSRQLIGLGSYIVNGQGGCNDCHTNPPFLPGGDPFLGQRTRINTAGYLAGGTPFGPVIRSPNLTPQKNGRPANLTFEQFRVVMRTGVDLAKAEPHVPSLDRDLLQVMPWPVYRHMRRADLRAIYEYLRAIPSIPEEE